MNQEVVVDKLTNRQIVKQSNILNTAKYSLSSLAFDILHLFLAQIYKEDQEFKHYRIKISDIENHLGRMINMKYLDKSTDEILKCIIKVKTEDGTIKKRTLAYACDLNRKKNLVEFKISDDMKEYLLGLKKHFVQSSYQETLMLNTYYAKRLYLLFMQYKSTGFYTVTISDLKFFLDLENAKSYKRFSEFKKRVLTPSLKQINENSPYNVYMHEVKEGRTVVRLEFTIEKKSNVVEEKDFGKVVEEFISFFKEKTDSNEHVTVDSKMRLKELLRSFSIEDLQKVAVYFHKKWNDDPEFSKFIRIKTLYNDKFEERLFEANEFFMNYERSYDLIHSIFEKHYDLIQREAKNVSNPFEIPFGILEKIIHWNKFYTGEEILETIKDTVDSWSKDPKVAPHINLSTILNAKFKDRAAAALNQPVREPHKSGVVAADLWLKKRQAA